MPLENQPTSQPTNKVVAGTLGASVGPALYLLAALQWPQLKDPELQIVLMPIISAAFSLGPAWFKRNLTEFSQERLAGRNWWVTIGGVVGIAAASAATGYFIR